MPGTPSARRRRRVQLPYIVNLQNWLHSAGSRSIISSAERPVAMTSLRNSASVMPCLPRSMRDSVNFDESTFWASSAKVIPFRLRKSRSAVAMLEGLHNMQPFVKAVVAPGANDAADDLCAKLHMSPIDRIHAGKTPTRRHYIGEWAKKRGVKKADIARAVGADKSLVTRWINESIIPGEAYLEALAAYLEAGEVAALFRHPDEDWMKRLFDGRSSEERQRMLETLEVAFPRPAEAGGKKVA